MIWARIPTAWGEFYGGEEGERIAELQFPGAGVAAGEAMTPALRALARELEAYLRGTRKEFSVPLLVNGSEFQQEVWALLRRIPYGTTVTYSDLARRAGRPTGARAVGGAVGANPLPILIPCHRVLPAAGGLGGFGPGIRWKQRLLDLEGIPTAR